MASVTTVLCAALGAGALVRAFYHPARALIQDGFVSQCAGSDTSCDPHLTVDGSMGSQPVYAVVGGVIVAAGPDWVALVPNHEAVVLTYGNLTDVAPAGSKVGVGQMIGRSPRLSFGVSRIDRDAAGSVKLTPYEPTSWLAVRGLGVSVKSRHSGQNLWCEGGRTLSVPQQVGRCGIALPAPSAWALLPVSVTLS
jgi:hypothetical protein